MDTTAERIAKNDATFRDANEQIERTAAEVGMELVPFICECADTGCTAIVRLSLGEYEAIRADSRHFLNAPGHEINAEEYGAVIDRTERYVVVEKQGEAAAIVEQLDPRDTEISAERRRAGRRARTADRPRRGSLS